MQNLRNLHPWPVNLTESSEITANHPNSAQSAPPSDKYCEICAFCTQPNRKVINYYTHTAHILLHIIIGMHICLHTCRLVLNAYDLTISTVFYIEFYVFCTKLYNHFRTIDPNNIPKQNFKCCRYTRLYPVHLLTNYATF